MTKVLRSKKGVGPLASVLGRQSRSIRELSTQGTTYVLNSQGDCVFVFGSDISAVPEGAYSASPTTASTGLTGAGAAVLDDAGIWEQLSGGGPPSGCVQMWAGPTATPPAGWLICNGSAVSRTTYAALYAALGGASSPWGQGDGSTTFNVPDMRSRTPVGAGQGTGLTNRALAGSGGEETHQLSAAESGTTTHNHTQASHSHSDSGHNHSYPGAGATGWAIHVASSSLGLAASSSNPTTWTTAPSAVGTAAISSTTPAINNATAAGASSAHNNMQPWAAINFIIKA